MGFFKNIFTGSMDVAGGGFDFVTEVGDAAVELAKGDFDDAAEILVSSAQEDLMGQALGGMFGPEGVVGSLIGALPEEVRQPGRAVLTPTMDAWQWTIDEVVDRPLGTIATVVNASMGDGVQALFNADTWAEAYEINDQRTFGQSLVTALYGIDPFNEDQYNSIRDDPMFNLISGTADFFQEFLDPVVLATSGGVGLARGSVVVGSRSGKALIARRGAGLVDPTKIRVIGGGTGARFGRTGLLKKSGEIGQEGTQADRAHKIAKSVAADRATSFMDTNRFRGLETQLQAIDARVFDSALDEAVDGYTERFSAIENTFKGRAGRQLPEDVMARWARGASTEAREITLRIASGDFSAIEKAQEYGRHTSQRLLDDPGLADRVAEHNRLVSERAQEAKLPEFAGDDAIGASLAEAAAVREARIVELSDEAIQFNEEVNRVDWRTVYEFDTAMKQAQQKSMIGTPSGYAENPKVALTLNSADDYGVFRMALDEMIVESPDVISLVRGELASGLKELPYGRAYERLRDSHSKKIRETGVTSVESVFRNSNAFGPRTIRVLTSNVSQTHIKFRDAANRYVQYERMLTEASEVTLHNGEQLIDAAEVNQRLASFADAIERRSHGDMISQYDRTVESLTHRFDDSMPEGTTRETLWEKYVGESDKFNESQKQVQGVTGDGTPLVVHHADQATVESSVGGGALEELAVDWLPEPDGRLAFSTSHIADQRVLPRWDLISNEMDKFWRRKRAVEAKGGRLVVSKALDGAEIARRTTGVAASKVMNVWRPGVLLTPKWPMRVGLDEQLRIASDLGMLETIAMFVRSVPDLSRTLARRSVTRNGESLLDVANDLGEIRKKLDGAIKAKGITIPDNIASEDLFWRVEQLGKEGLDEVLGGMADQALKESRTRRASIQAMKGMGVFAVFNAPVGVTYAAWSMHRRAKRIRQVGQQQASFNLAEALQYQGHRLVADAVSPEMVADAEMLIRRGEFIAEEAERLLPNMPIEAWTIFDQVDQLLDDAGFPAINHEGQARVRGGFGDNVQNVQEHSRHVSSSDSMNSAYGSARDRAGREGVAYNPLNWERFDLMVEDTRVAAEHAYTRMFQQYTTRGEFKNFYDPLWRNGDLATRVDDLEAAMRDDAALRSQLGARHATDEQVREAAEATVREYDNVLPPELFGDLRDRAFSGEPLTYTDIQIRLRELRDERGFGSLGETITHIRDDLGYEDFGKSFGPDKLTSPDNNSNRFATWVNGRARAAFEVLGSGVSDNMARNPYYQAVYEREITRRMSAATDTAGGASLSQRSIDAIEDEARGAALGEVRTLLYDLAEDTRVSEVMANLMPFYNAWGEVISRWAGMAVANPQYVGNAYRLYTKAWDAETLGITEVTDEESGSSYLTFRLTNPVGAEGQRTIWDSMPQVVRDTIIPESLQDPDRTLRFSKDGLASMMQSVTPGFGPLVSIPVREAILANPSMEESFEFMFPFGHPEGGVLERVLKDSSPTWLKSVDDYVRDSHTNERMVQSMFLDYSVQREEAGNPIDFGDPLDVNMAIEIANDRAKEFHLFRIAAGLFSPTSTTQISPYAPLMTIARDLQREHGTREGNARFLADYGEDLFALTARMTQLNDGVSASVESEELYMQHQDLVAAYPDIGAWVTASLGATDEVFAFSQASYRRQRNMEISESDDRERRERLTPVETVAKTQAELGWMAYTELNDAVRSEQSRRQEAGLPYNLNNTSMQQVAQYKSDQIDLLKIQYPAWAEQFGDFGASDTRMKNVVDGFLAGLDNEQILLRPSTAHVIEYFQLRQAVQDELTRRDAEGGSRVLTANSNADLELYFEEQKAELGDRPEFSAIYDRFFERDSVRPATFTTDGQFKLGFI